MTFIFVVILLTCRLLSLVDFLLTLHFCRFDFLEISVDIFLLLLLQLLLLQHSPPAVTPSSPHSRSKYLQLLIHLAEIIIKLVSIFQLPLPPRNLHGFGFLLFLFTAYIRKLCLPQLTHNHTITNTHSSSWPSLHLQICNLTSKPSSPSRPQFQKSHLKHNTET